jgi:hypothetical protein
MRLTAIIAILLTSQFSLIAQSDEDSVHISTNFLKELDNAFGFRNEKPKYAELNTIEAIKPDTELLHQWVKDPKANMIATVSNIPTKVNIPGLTDGGFSKDLVLWRSKRHPDLMLLNTGNGVVASGLDINGFLSKYLTKEGRTLRKSRDLAESCKQIMDRFYPISGNPIFSKEDTMAVVNKTNNNR